MKLKILNVFKKLCERLSKRKPEEKKLQYRITDKGRDLLEYLDTEEGMKLYKDYTDDVISCKTFNVMLRHNMKRRRSAECVN